MAITVKDIREQDFDMINGGYNVDQVDDFLDAVANQMEAVELENSKLKAQLEEAAAAKAELENAPAVVEENTLPAFNEPSYFKNLETTLRETLISAQRIADETIDDARKKARKIVAEAEEQAQTIEEQSQQKMTEAKADYEALKNAFEDYRKNFSELVENHTKLLKDSPLFD